MSTVDQFVQPDFGGRIAPPPPTPAEIRAWAIEIAECLIRDEAAPTNPDLWQAIPHRFDSEGDLVRTRHDDYGIVDAVRGELRKIAAEVTRRG